MFQLTTAEAEPLSPSRSQSVILNRGSNVKYRPYVFTEHGTVMLANVLKSATAVRASIQVVRAFVNLRRMVAANDELTHSIERLERRVDRHDTDLHAVLMVLKKLVEPSPLPPKRRSGSCSPPDPPAPRRPSISPQRS